MSVFAHIFPRITVCRLAKYFDESKISRDPAGKFAEKGGGEVATNDTKATNAGRQTDSTAFKAWFGNSQVVDANGKPQVMYHGTTKDFAEFKNYEEYGGGHGPIYFFTANTDYANVYAGVHQGNPDGGAVYPAFLRAEKVFDTTNSKHMAMVKRSFKADGMEAWEAKAYLEDYFTNGLPNWDNGDMIRLAQKNGFDGIRLMERKSGIESIGMFDPTNIKSATGNRGTFDPADKDITKHV